MRKQFVSVVVAIVFAAAGFLAIVPVSNASAASYGTYCGNANSPVYWVGSGSLYTYRLAGTNYFCSLNINPYWGSKRTISITVSRPGYPTYYDGGQYYYYAGPLIYTLGYGQCASVMGVVANLNLSNRVDSALSVCNR